MHDPWNGGLAGFLLSSRTHHPILLSVLILSALVVLKKELQNLRVKAYQAHIFKTHSPSDVPSPMPSPPPSFLPSILPTYAPTILPAPGPSLPPLPLPTLIPTLQPSGLPTLTPSLTPSPLPTQKPSMLPTTRRRKHVTRTIARKGYDLRQKAAAGDAAAAMQLGFMYTTSSKGVDQNFKEAAKFFRRATELCNHDSSIEAASYYNLALLAFDGRGMEKNWTKAAVLYQKAALSGHAGAQFNLGSLYARGQGVPMSQRTAVYWLQRAASQGIAEAQGILASS